MIYPSTTLRYINDVIGYGVFATEFIPEGTIIYVQDKWEVVISEKEFDQQPDHIKEKFERYSYIDDKGDRIISWDIAKYVNHCCMCNTMSTGYGFEIAIRDIHPGEEITDEYGMFNLNSPINLLCDKPGCRKTVRPEDFDLYYSEWDEKVKKSLKLLRKVNQPLWHLLNDDTMNDLEQFLDNDKEYKSIYSLKYEKTMPGVLSSLNGNGRE